VRECTHKTYPAFDSNLSFLSPSSDVTSTPSAFATARLSDQSSFHSSTSSHVYNSMSSYQAYGGRETPPHTNDASTSKPRYPYPPNNSLYGTSNSDSQDDVVSPLKSKHTDVVVDMREISRTPSPTPSEVAELKNTHVIDFKAMANWRWWLRKEWFCTFDLIVCSIRQFHSNIFVTL